MNEKECLITTYESAKNIIKNDLESMSKKFITIGYYLKYIRNNEMYTQDGFTSIWEFAQETYGISKSTCSKWMSMNDKFSKDGNSPYLREEFANFGKSQLQEMLYLDDTQIEKATPEMTAKEIRQLKEPEEIPGQMEIQDYPEVLPEEKIPYFSLEGEAYGWTWKEVVKTYLKNGYKKLESGTEVKCLGKMYLVLRRKEKTFFYDSQGSALFEVDNKRLETEYEYMQSTNTPKEVEEQEETLPEVQQEAEEEQIEPVAPAQQQNHIFAKPDREEEGKEQQEEETEYKIFAIKRFLFEQEEELAEYEACEGLPARMVLRKRIIVDALKLLLASREEAEEIPQPALPEMKNNDQRKEWLNNYRSWGIWYKDEHTGATYYRYQFDNGASLIAEEYECESQYTETYTSSYLHLVGGPEPPRKSGIPKWNRNEKYNRCQNSETELVEFLKEVQKNGKK
ncbi:MAG: hypothetical protein UGF43_06485 [Blautia sp.]|uniref:hypothetical protein n=1 Tax=Blautia sp. TaxID=1955243 RepID=UPI002E78B992|nr:hypothetical protein [Blautia sp.]MEE1443250.1 hypothetical protein [Blautia sp.]